MAGDGDEETCKVVDVQRQGGKKARLGPILVSFEHGRVKSDRCDDFKPKLKYSFPSAASGDGSATKSRKPNICLKLKTKHVRYSNEVESVKQAGENHLVTYIGVRDKRSDKMRLVEANLVAVGAEIDSPPTTNMLLLEKAREEERKKEEADSKEDVHRARLDRKKHLVRSFGQAKGQRIYEQADRMQVKSDVLEGKLKTAAEAVDSSLLEETAGPESDAAASIAPPVNREAGFVRDVYKMDDIISAEERVALAEAAEEMMNSGEWNSVEDIEKAVKAKTFSPLFGYFFEVLFDKASYEESLGVALYMEALITLMGLRQKERNQKGNALPRLIPAAIRNKIFKTFSNPQGGFSTEERDRCTCYILVLALLVGNFSVQVKLVTASTKIGQDRLKKLAMVVGAGYATDSLTDLTHIVLKIPLVKYDANKVISRAKKKN